MYYIINNILSRASEMGSPTNNPGLWAATRHGVRDPLVRDLLNMITCMKTNFTTYKLDHAFVRNGLVHGKYLT